MTTDNPIRAQALKLLQATADDLPPQQARLLVSEVMSMRRLAKELGVPSFHRWLAEMSSREYTGYRAQMLVETASEIVRNRKSDDPDTDETATWARQFEQK